MSDKRMTIGELAKIANVSTATVSRAFRQPDTVCPETKSMILKIAEDHHYEPKIYKKRSSTSHKNPFIAVVVADMQNVFFQEIISSISDVLKSKGISLFICNSQESAENELQCLNMLEQLQVDGLFISPVSEASPINSEILKSFHKKGVPVILIDRDIKGIGLDGVFQDSYYAAFSATEKLLENKHIHIAHIAGPTTSMPGLDRLNGYIDSLKKHDVPIREEYIVYGDFKQESGYRLTKKLLQNCPDITAIYAANNLMAIGALKAINEAGLSIPNDIAFISTGVLDHFDLFGNAVITEIVQPISTMGEECARMMLERLNSGLQKRKTMPVRRIIFDDFLVLKGSEVYPQNRLVAEY